MLGARIKSKGKEGRAFGQWGVRTRDCMCCLVWSVQVRSPWRGRKGAETQRQWLSYSWKVFQSEGTENTTWKPCQYHPSLMFLLTSVLGCSPGLLHLRKTLLLLMQRYLVTFTQTAVVGMCGCLVDIVSAAYAAEMTLEGYFCSFKYTGLQPHRMPGYFFFK